MKETKIYRLMLGAVLLLWMAGVVGCRTPLPPADAEATPSVVPVTPQSTAPPSSTPTPPPTPTPTPLPPLLVLLAPPEADPQLSQTLQASLSKAAQQAGMRWQVRPALSPQETASEVDYVVALPPAQGLVELVRAAPETRFLAVGFDDLEPAPNLIAFTGGGAPDQQGFLAGYIAAMITPQWRVGVISVEDTQDGQAARIGFQTGVRFFCGLCRTQVPPFYDYPLYIGLPADASDAEWRAVADFLIDRQVKTIYIVPGAGGEDLLRYLNQFEVYLIGGVKPPEGLQGQWVASIRVEIEQVYQQNLPRLLGGEAGVFESLPLQVTDVNEELLSPGKQHLLSEVVRDLQAGFIGTGVDSP